jgi:imidazoleglycerol-phosphate dehydratase/histidinol-phosphatase
MFKYMRAIATELDYELVMVSNQDGLGSADFPEEDFYPVHNFIMKSLENENIHFSAQHFDRTYPAENAPTRKPGIGLFTSYLNNENYDIPNSYVIGDRITDVQLAKNLGCKAIWINNDANLGGAEIKDAIAELEKVIVLETTEWKEIYKFLKLGLRRVTHERNTNETKINIELNLDGSGKAEISTGLGFLTTCSTR